MAVIHGMLIFLAGSGSLAFYTLHFPIPVTAFIYLTCSAFCRSPSGKPVLCKGWNCTEPGR